jgi:Kazal-type serine protease inhibitor domain
MKVGMMNDACRWAFLFAFVGWGCLATPVPDGAAADDDQHRGPAVAEEVSASFVEGLPCDAAADCGRRLYCRYPDGQCGGAGTCEARPRACTQIFAPVCGCDDETYASACAAASAGIGIQDTGECGAKAKEVPPDDSAEPTE